MQRLQVIDMEYCHYDYEEEQHDCLDYMECEECPYYYADLDQVVEQMERLTEKVFGFVQLKAGGNIELSEYIKIQGNRTGK